jgi:uncharacterized membrane protein (Fun14 family)
MATDLAPFAGAVGGGFFVGFITGYAIKKVIKLAAVIVGLFLLPWHTWNINEFLVWIGALLRNSLVSSYFIYQSTSS